MGYLSHSSRHTQVPVPVATDKWIMGGNNKVQGGNKRLFWLFLP